MKSISDMNLAEVTLAILGAAVNIPDGMYARAQHLAKEELGALLDKPVNFLTPDCPDCACVQDGQCLCIPSKPAANHQDSNPGWPDPLESALAKEIINNPAAFDLAIRDLFDKLCREIQAGRYYRRFSGSEPMEFTANQREPVAWIDPICLERMARQPERNFVVTGVNKLTYNVPLYAEQPAPVSVMHAALVQSQTDLQEGHTVSVEQLRDNLVAKFIGKKP